MVLLGELRISTDKVFWGLIGGLSFGVHEKTSRLSIFIMLFKSPDCRLLSPSVPSSVTIQLSILNELRKNCSSLSASNTDEGDRHSLTQPNFPLWKQFHAKKSLALSCAALEDG